MQVTATIAHQRFALRRADIERRLRDVLPEPLDQHFVIVNGRRFPPKQVVSAATGLDRADFNTHQARQVLRRLGFVVSRRGEAPAAAPEEAPSQRLRLPGADVLRPLNGRWVALLRDEVLVAADTPEAVIEWLERHNRQADEMFRVPRDERESGGLAPQ